MKRGRCTFFDVTYTLHSPQCTDSNIPYFCEPAAVEPVGMEALKLVLWTRRLNLPEGLRRQTSQDTAPLG